MNNPWDKIFNDDFEGALAVADENFKNLGDKFNLRTRALILLQIGRYSDSLNDFLLLKEIDKKDNTVSDDTYLFLGLCYYGLDQINEAKEYFEYPVKKQKEFKYTVDISVAPAILYLFSLKLGDVKYLSVVEKTLLKKKTLIAEFLTDRINEKEFENQFINPALEHRHKCRAEFYKGVKFLKNSDFKSYFIHLAKAIELKGNYLDFEYYISKVEIDKQKIFENAKAQRIKLLCINAP